MAVNIKSFTKVVPMIYAYTTPGIPYHDGWIKIGYTEKQTVEQRIKQQTHTANIKWELQWKDNAMFKDGSGDYFTDKDFHSYLEVEKKVKQSGLSWISTLQETILILLQKEQLLKKKKGLVTLLEMNNKKLFA